MVTVLTFRLAVLITYVLVCLPTCGADSHEKMKNPIDGTISVLTSEKGDFIGLRVRLVNNSPEAVFVRMFDRPKLLWHVHFEAAGQAETPNTRDLLPSSESKPSFTIVKLRPKGYYQLDVSAADVISLPKTGERLFGTLQAVANIDVGPGEAEAVEKIKFSDASVRGQWPVHVSAGSHEATTFHAAKPQTDGEIVADKFTIRSK